MYTKTSSNASRLEVAPRSIDFSRLSHRQGAASTLNIRGGPGSIIITGNHLKVATTGFSHEGADIEVTLLPGSAEN